MSEDITMETVDTPDGDFETTETTETTDKTITEEVDAVLDDASADADAESADGSIEDGDAADSEPQAELTAEEQIEGILNLDDGTPDGKQRRIDKITAKNYQLQAELDKIKSQLESAQVQAPTGDIAGLEKPEYTDKQLATAMEKAIANEDTSLMAQIFDEKIKNVKYDMAQLYQQDKNRASEEQRASQREWKTIVDTYDYLSDPNEAELYSGSHGELNIGDPNSIWFQLAKRLYTDADKSQKYSAAGGRQLAVADALKLILKSRNKRLAENKDGAKLKRRLAKVKKAQSIGSIKADKAEVASKSNRPMTDKARLDEYVGERRKAKDTAMGF